MENARNNRRVAGLVAFMVMIVGVGVGTGAWVPSSPRPTNTRPLSASMPENAMQFFKDKNFGGTMFQISDVTTKPSWKAHQFEGKKENKVTSVRWNLPQGVVVSLHQDDDGLGRSLFLFGSGELDSLSPWKLNDKMSSWAWNYTGGLKSPSKPILDALAPRPRFATECEPIPIDTIQLFKNRDAKGTMTSMDSTLAPSEGVFRDLPTSKSSSMKWNLPDGVLVVLSEGAGGEGQQIGIWGRGMFDSFHRWDLNDKLTQWSWYDLRESSGSAATAPAP